MTEDIQKNFNLSTHKSHKITLKASLDSKRRLVIHQAIQIWAIRNYPFTLSNQH